MKTPLQTVLLSRTFNSKACYAYLRTARKALLALAFLAVGHSLWAAEAAANIAWVRTFDAPRGLAVSDVAADESGDAYIACNFSGRVTLGNFKLVSEGGDDCFVAKLSQLGDVLWVSHQGTVDTDQFLRVAADASGNCYAYGLQDSANRRSSIFVSKYAPTGDRMWTRPVPPALTYRTCSGYSANKKILFAVDGLGNCFLVPQGMAPTVVELGADGIQRWSTPLGDRGAALNEVRALVELKSGGVIVAVDFHDTVKVAGQTLVPNKDKDFFTALLDTDGKVVWAAQSDCREDSSALAVATGRDDTVYVLAQVSKAEGELGGKAIEQSKMKQWPGRSDTGPSFNVLVKYQRDGKVVGAVRFGGELGDVDEMRIAPTGGAVFRGDWFSDYVGRCGWISIKGPNIVRYSFVGSISDDGEPLWALPLFFVNSEKQQVDYQPRSIAVSGRGDVFLGSARSLIKVDVGTGDAQSGPSVLSTKGSLSSMLQDICPQGRLGEFRHGTKCVGYYEAAQPEGKLKLVDIQVAGKASSKSYTKTKSLVHAGVDIVAPAGSEIRAVADGTVDDVIVSPNDENFGSLGYMVIVEHSEKYGGKPLYSVYLHMKEKPKVTVGQSVKAGETVLGLVGSTGAAFGPHVHFELRRFAGRFSPKWKNIYGIERPKDEATFDEADFAANWLNPENPAAGTSGPSGQTSQDTGTAESSKASPISGPATDPSDPVALEKQLKELMSRTPRAPDQPDKILSDAKAGVTVSYPAAFAVSREKRPVVAFFLAPNGGETEQSHAKISVTCSGTPLLNPNPPLESVVNSTMVGTKSALVDATISRPLKTTLAGGEAQVFFVTGKEDGVVRQKAVTVAVYRKHILGVVLHATPETFLKYWDDYRRVCDSYALR